MDDFLTQAQCEALRARHRREKDKRVCDRIKAVLLFNQGYGAEEVASILLLDDETVRRYLNDYLKKLKLTPAHRGSRSKLNDEQTQALIAHLRERTYLYVKDIRAYVEKTFKIRYSTRGMTHWLHAQGFCYKKPHGVPAKADIAKQNAFIETYESLKNGLNPDEIICFADSSHPQHQTKLAYGWIEKGVRKPEKMTACQKRLNIMGAIDIASHDIQWRSVDWVNTESIKEFLTQLSKHYGVKKKIHLIWDNAGYHKSAEVQIFASTLNIKLHYLPPYSPNLNPIERLWKLMHEKITYNRYYEKFKDFKEAIHSFFDNVGEYKSVIRSRITDNFQRLEIT